MKVYSIRLDPDLMARVDALECNRSDFIRDAIEGRLSGGSKSVETRSVQRSAKVAPVARTNGFGADAAAVLELARRKRVSSRDAEKHFAWLGLRYQNAETELLNARAIRFEGGVLVPNE